MFYPLICITAFLGVVFCFILFIGFIADIIPNEEDYKLARICLISIAVCNVIIMTYCIVGSYMEVNDQPSKSEIVIDE